jgi:hypothetical protein
MLAVMNKKIYWVSIKLLLLADFMSYVFSFFTTPDKLFPLFLHQRGETKYQLTSGKTVISGRLNPVDR